ncbi:uncharacterized protein LOC141499588 [Macrotis lagotis]|uniref:uncharacterized protein LOC141499588 n=1 Tax=Macrotis lagotis TaxID=92651 RepID=UPI003D690B5D
MAGGGPGRAGRSAGREGAGTDRNASPRPSPPPPPRPPSRPPGFPPRPVRRHCARARAAAPPPPAPAHAPQLRRRPRPLLRTRPPSRTPPSPRSVAPALGERTPPPPRLPAALTPRVWLCAAAAAAAASGTNGCAPAHARRQGGLPRAALRPSRPAAEAAGSRERPGEAGAAEEPGPGRAGASASTRRAGTVRGLVGRADPAGRAGATRWGSRIPSPMAPGEIRPMEACSDAATGLGPPPRGVGTSWPREPPGARTRSLSLPRNRESKTFRPPDFNILDLKAPLWLWLLSAG